MDCSHPAARTGGSRNSPIAGRARSNFSEWVLAMGINFDDFEMSRVNAKPHAYFIYNCTQTLEPLSYT